MATKTDLDINVYEAALQRIKWCFDNFQQVMVSFSGGKDSGVCLSLCYDYAKENNLLDRLAVYHLDYEAQYQATTDYVTDVFNNQLPGIKKFWLCLPIEAQCCCKMDSTHWTPWAKDEKSIWVRQMPESPYLVSEDNAPFKVEYGLTDNEMQDVFNHWFASKYGSTALVIGIRADESMSRRKLVTSTSDSLIIHRKDGKFWTVEDGDVCRAYVMYDWKVEDVWTYFGKFDKKYNSLYDLYYKAGIPIKSQRVASPFNYAANATLKFYKVIDPNTWGRMVSRVNGVNFVGLYGDTKLMGWRKITKPDGFTWKQYFDWLLSAYPPEMQERLRKKIEVSKKSWVRGGTMDEKDIVQLLEEGAPITITPPKTKSGKRVVHFDGDYMDDTTIQNFARIPTWKRACVCLLKNDLDFRYMGFGIDKKELERRSRALEKFRGV